MNEEYREGFRKIYADYSDEDIRSLLKEGDMFFDEESWKLLQEEAEKRSITNSDGTRLKKTNLKDRLRALLKIVIKE
jgi:hypothetical protein